MPCSVQVGWSGFIWDNAISPILLYPILFNPRIFYPIPLHCPVWQLSLRFKIVWSLTKKNSALKFGALYIEDFIHLFKKYHVLLLFHFSSFGMSFEICITPRSIRTQKILEEKSLAEKKIDFLGDSNFFPLGLFS